MKLTIASGKGGTGKTTVALNMAYSLSRNGENVNLLDCDVEEPNDHLFINEPFIQESEVNVIKPKLDSSKCTLCGKCAEACTYNALATVKKKLLIFNELCHSCGLCMHVCPHGALTEVKSPIGTIKTTAEKSNFKFIHGELNIGESLAPQVIGEVKKHIDNNKINIIDASPGTTCPVVEASKGSDAVILVTEPTPFGLNDLILAANLFIKLGIPAGVVINRSDENDEIIESYTQKANIPILGKIPFDRKYAVAYSKGELLVDTFNELNETFLNIFNNTKTLIHNPPTSRIISEDLVTSEGELSKIPTGPKNHKELTIISGKGGTGKTTIAAALSQLIDNKILNDCDVDAADLHLLLKPELKENYKFIGGQTAEIDTQKCTSCGKCEEVCNFGAVTHDSNSYTIDKIFCEGCSFCSYVCEDDAIELHESISGHWMISDTEYGKFVHAKLGIGEENSGKLVSKVRGVSASLASHFKTNYILSDGPPGIGCPVIASLTGTDLVLLVVEPTVSGVHDMKRVLDLTKHFGIKAYILINKADLNSENSNQIENLAKTYKTEVIAKVPFDRNVHQSLVEGKDIIEYGRGPAYEIIKELGTKIRKLLAEQ